MKATKERETSQGKSCQSKRKLRLWEEKVEKWEKNEENHSSAGSYSQYIVLTRISDKYSDVFQ